MAGFGDGFVLCRRGCLLNSPHVDSMDRNTGEIVPDNKERCLCSHRSWRLLAERISDRKTTGKV